MDSLNKMDSLPNGGDEFTAAETELCTEMYNLEQQN